jgi:hypothetical protein
MESVASSWAWRRKRKRKSFEGGGVGVRVLLGNGAVRSNELSRDCGRSGGC